MSIKSAIGKGTAISHPAAGSMKSAQSSITTGVVGLQMSKSSADNVGIEKVEESKPAEIIALADFNRIYETGTFLTPYGKYYQALNVVQSITTDDVSYVVSKAIEKDTSKKWSSLSKNLDIAISDADDFINDLANINEKIEKAMISLDFARSDDNDLQQAGQDYLTSKLKTYETTPESRKYNLDSILVQKSSNRFLDPGSSSKSFSSTGGNSSAIKQILNNVIKNKIFEKPYKEIFELWGQEKEEKDLNPEDSRGANEGEGWKAFNESNSLLAPIEILSNVMSISTGIQSVQQDSISGKLGFKKSNLGSMFEGMNPGGVKEKSDPTPYKKNSNRSNLTALSMLQFKKSDGSIILPIEIEDSPDKKAYKSGQTGLVRDAILTGDYTFSDFKSYLDQFEESRQDIESYAEKMLGLLDSSNMVTPLEVFRAILSSFSKALSIAKSDESSRFQLLYTSFCNSDAEAIQQLLRVVGKIKYYRLKSKSGFAGGDDAPGSKSLSTSKTSVGSETLTSDATVTTTEVENKSEATLNRIIKRTASSSPPAVDLADFMIRRLVEGSPFDASYLDIRKKIEEAEAEIDDLEKEISTLQSRALSDAKNGNYNSSSLEDISKYEEDVDSLESYIIDLKNELNSLPTYVGGEIVSEYFQDGMIKTSGTFWSCIVDAYDKIVLNAQKRLPSDTKITNDLGLTLYGSFDEFGLLAMIVKCFVSLSSTTNFKCKWEASSDVTSGFGAYKIDILGLNISGYSSRAIDNYIKEISLLTSDTNNENLASTKFLKASLAKKTFDELSSNATIYQNAMAYLSAFSKAMLSAREDLESAFANILESSSRRASLDTPEGRKMISSLTSQQIVYRRSLLDKYRPAKNLGYLPARFAFSLGETTALNDMLSSPEFASRTSENIRIISAAVPAGTIDSTKKYKDSELGEQNYTGMIELIIFRRDYEFDDIIFKEKIFLFDPQLYVSPDSFVSYRKSKNTSDSDRSLAIGKKITFKLYSKDSSQTLTYADLLSNPRYESLSKKQKNEIVKNTTLSYLLESYIFNTTGMLFDESVTLKIKDSISQAGVSALGAISSQNIQDLVLPTSSQLSEMINANGDINYATSISGITSGDRELIAALASSYIMKDENPIDRLLSNSEFDRTFIVSIDPDNFYIDEEETGKVNGEIGRSMLKSIKKNDLLIKDDESLRISPRDPLNGGFSIGDVTCQFIPHTSSKTEGSMLKQSKELAQSKVQRGITSKSDIQSKEISKTKKARTNKGVKL